MPTPIYALTNEDAPINKRKRTEDENREIYISPFDGNSDAIIDFYLKLASIV